MLTHMHVPNKACFFTGLKHVFYMHLVTNNDPHPTTLILTTELSHTYLSYHQATFFDPPTHRDRTYHAYPFPVAHTHHLYSINWSSL